MSAETVVYVKRSRLIIEWIETQAVTLNNAVKEVQNLESTFRVLDARYDKPEE